MKAFSELTSASQVNNSDLLAISQASGNDFVSKKTTVKNVADFANQNLAEEYDSTSTYAVDDFVMYESALYKCVTAVSSAEAFDPTKWTQVVVTDEMGSGGGGGTGGHTIIDENGNSMTARAGLQFVGGANVSDDGTNNKTIVDLASAGGIDGVFIDTDNIIQASTTLTANSTTNYTATEDCVIRTQLWTGGNGKSSSVSIDGVELNTILSSSGSMAYYFTFLLKKGQVATFEVTGQSAYTVYGIQTGTTHSKFQPVIYSTEEREIGVWTDGKPLYQKSVLLSQYNVSLSDNAWTNIFAVTDWETLVAAEINTQTPNTKHNLRFQLLSGYVQGASKENINLSSYNNLYVTYCYTKSTDTAGSGTWTPQGVPTHHYSTDEHIVGTWIDGSTLYEKTIDLGSDTTVPQNSWSWLASITNVETIVLCFGNYSTGTYYPLMAYHDGDKINVMACRDGASASVRYLTLQYTKSS